MKIIYGKQEEPWAEQYKFGWTIIGKVCLDESSGRHEATANRVTVVEKEDGSAKLQKNKGTGQFVSNSLSKDMTSPKEIKEMMQLDYSEIHYSRSIRGTEQSQSAEDRRFNQILSKGVHTNFRGNWEMPLPFKTDEISLPNNREHCLRRLLSLKRKMQKDDKLHADYVQFMEKIIKREHASPIPDEELNAPSGQFWYLPHFQVYHPKKPDQIRVVFECSTVYEGDSLNKHLLQGPEWMNGLVGVLSRFRKEETAVSCDIEQMFHNFAVNPEHRDFLRFLWFKDNDINQSIVEYKMNVHLFGAVSSPGVANFGLMTTAKEGSEKFGDQAREFLEQEFYVDDGLKSFAKTEEAIATIKNTQAMCATSDTRRTTNTTRAMS